MKKLIIVFILITMFLVNIKSTECQNEYQIFYNYMEVEFPDVSPTVEAGRTLVPFRTLAQALGVEVEYISDKKEIIGSKDSYEIKMKISDRKYYINEKEFVMLVAPKIINGRTVIPLRDFSEAFGLGVDFNNGVINITKDYQMNIDMNIESFYALGDQQSSSWSELFGANYPEISTDPHLKLYDSIYLGWYEIYEGKLTSSNTIHKFNRPNGYENVIEGINQFNKSAYMMVFAQEDGSLIKTLESEYTKKNIIDDIVYELRVNDYQGVNLDIEGLGSLKNRDEIEKVKRVYNSFVSDLKDQIGSRYELVLTLPPANSVYQGYDYKILGDLADKIIIMAYDYHDRDTPSATAPIEKVREGLEEILEEVKSEKVLLGITLSALRYQKSSISGEKLNFDSLLDDNQEDWKLSNPYLQSVYNLIDEKNLTQKWHSEYASTYVYFKEDNTDNIIFLESKEGFLRKLELVEELNLDGIALWRLGIIPELFYEMINNLPK